MPVIRGQLQESVVTDEQRRQAAEQLENELSGQQTLNGPVIFEIPFEQQERIDVLVVWDAWRPFRSTERSDMILAAYQKLGAPSPIAQALGVTYQEAIEQQVLPYAVVPMVRRGELDEEQVKQSMVAEGAFTLPDGKVDLRFPTLALAEQAHKRLTDALPQGYWSIVQSAGYPQ